MTSLHLGAINCETSVYTRPYEADKSQTYKCPDKSCGQKVILKCGEIIPPYFSHLANEIKCPFYTYHDSESTKHRHVKETVRNLLNKKLILGFIKKCNCCGMKITIKLDYPENGYAESEKRMTFNEKTIIPDVSYLYNQNILKYIVEVFHTHKTMSENRPEPYFEISAQQFIDKFDEELLLCFNTHTLLFLELECVKQYICENCSNLELSSIIKDISEKKCNECDGYGIFKSPKVSPKLCIMCTCCHNKKVDNLCAKCSFLNKVAEEYTEILSILKDINSIRKKLSLPRQTLEKNYYISYSDIGKWNLDLFSNTKTKLLADRSSLNSKL